MGEGDWDQIQKRINFQSSGVIKNSNQVANRYHTVKRLMKRDIKKMQKKLNGSKIVT